MAIMIKDISIVTATCDSCGREETQETYDSHRAVNDFLECGWVNIHPHSGELSLCPPCYGKLGLGNN